MKTFEDWFDTSDDSNVPFLMKCLSPTLTSEDCRTARNTHQNSLVKLLLGVEQFQVTTCAAACRWYRLRISNVGSTR